MSWRTRRGSARSLRSLLRDPVCLLALGLGTGLAPVAPGTVGSLPGLALFLLLTPRMNIVAALGVASLLFLLGVFLCQRCARRIGIHDHPAIVWDEITGCFVACALAPEGALWALAAFGLFRFFDVLKPWPIRELDHGLGGGAGIMLDDVVAALCAAGVLQSGRWLLTTGWG